MSKQILLLSFLNKSKHVSVESKIKGTKQEMNVPVGNNKSVRTWKYDDSYFAFSLLEHIIVKQVNCSCVVCCNVLSTDAKTLNTWHSKLA
jgi:hypothetical protein